MMETERVGQFWESVFQDSEKEYDWFAGYDTLSPYMIKYGLKKEHKILNIGCGKSKYDFIFSISSFI